MDSSRLDPQNPLTTPITMQEATLTIKTFNSPKARGIRKINRISMMNLPNPMMENLTQIYSASLATGPFPDIFKTAVLKLIPKANKSINYAENYRPISLLEITRKIYEKIINNRLLSYI